jgi:membrane fusion protein (multidrug efflux system)
MSDKLNILVKTTFLKKKRFIITAAALLILGCTFGLYYYFYARSHISTDDAFIEGHAISISPKISGHILKVYIDDNQQVKEGELLAEIDPPDYEVRYKMAEANLEAAQAKASQANEDVSRYKKLVLNDEISKQDMAHVLVRAHS